MASQTGSIDLTASNSVKLAAEAGWQSDLDGYYTKSEIDVTVSGINSTVSTKVGEDEVISSINQSSESVSINASKINLTGAVTISDLASDASTALTNAAETATSYVTELTGEDGIMVHPSDDDDTGVQITSDVDILRDGYSVINVGTQGDTSGNTNAGVTIYDGTANENVVATFAGDGIGLAGDAFHLTSVGTTSQSGVEHVTSDMSMDSANSSYKVSSYITTNTYLSNQLSDLLGQMRLGLATGDSTFSDVYEAPSINMYATADTSSMTAAADSVSVVADDQIELVSDQYSMEGVDGTSNTWSVPAGTVIWSASSGWQMAANVTATLDYNISTCPSGIVLHWQAYANSATQDYDHVYTFIPKQHVAVSSGKGVVCQLANSNFGYIGTKYVYVANGGITGHANNQSTGTANGITYANNHWVLTQVIAV